MMSNAGNRLPAPIQISRNSGFGAGTALKADEGEPQRWRFTAA